MTFVSVLIFLINGIWLLCVAIVVFSSFGSKVKSAIQYIRGKCCKKSTTSKSEVMRNESNNKSKSSSNKGGHSLVLEMPLKNPSRVTSSSSSEADNTFTSSSAGGGVSKDGSRGKRHVDDAMDTERVTVNPLIKQSVSASRGSQGRA